MRWVRGRIAGAAAILCGLALAASTGAAGPSGTGPVTNLPMPRYVSLNAPEINVRRGPGTEYRIDWVYRRSGLPVRIVDEFEHWRRIVDSEEADGWVYHALVSGRRTALVTATGVLLRKRPAGLDAAVDCAALAALPEGVVACAEQGAIAALRACERFWCRIEAGGREGWVPKAAIWGAGPEEEFGK